MQCEVYDLFISKNIRIFVLKEPAKVWWRDNLLKTLYTSFSYYLRDTVALQTAWLLWHLPRNLTGKPPPELRKAAPSLRLVTAVSIIIVNHHHHHHFPATDSTWKTQNTKKYKCQNDVL